MKYAIMSDAHANPAALETALADARRRGCRRFVFLGDVTGYGYDAKRTLALTVKSFDVILMGNHDSVCAGLDKRPEVKLNRNYDLDRAQGALLAKDELSRIAALPYEHSEENAAFVHGDFEDPKSWGYIFDSWDVFANFPCRKERFLFCGHTHRAAVWERDVNGECRPLLEDRLSSPAVRAQTLAVKVRKGCRYLVNVGSVGYPRNDFCASYALFDPQSGRLALRRLPFDFAGYVGEMVRRRIPLPIWLCNLLSRVDGGCGE